MYDRLKKLEELTKTNLQSQEQTFRDMAELSVNFANRCDIQQALRDFVLAQLAGKRLRDDALQRYIDGFITSNEYTDIVDESLEVVFQGLPAEITNSLVKSCGCKTSP